MSINRRLFTGAGLATAASLSPLSSRAQDNWPSKPIRMVVPFPPGGGTDIAARIVADKLAVRLGQAIVIDNKPGASTAIGTTAVITSPADGYTLLFSGSSSYTVNPAVRPQLGYDPFKQLLPLAVLARVPLVLVTSATSPYHNLAALIAKASANPGLLTYSTFGPGSAPHLAGELLAYNSGIKLTPVPYKGSAEATTGLMRGDITLGIDTLTAASPFIQSGKLHVLALVGEKRSKLLPNVPAYGELKLSTAMVDGWYAMAAPAAMPSSIRDRLLNALAAVMADTEVRNKLAQQSMEAVLLGPQAMSSIMDQEITRYRAIVARASIKIE